MNSRDAHGLFYVGPSRHDPARRTAVVFILEALSGADGHSKRRGDERPEGQLQPRTCPVFERKLAYLLGTNSGAQLRSERPHISRGDLVVIRDLMVESCAHDRALKLDEDRAALGFGKAHSAASISRW